MLQHPTRSPANRRALGNDRRVQTTSEAGTQALRLGVIIAALGVVFGDIGTSPIYTLQTVFNPGDPHPVPVTDTHVYGVVSLIFWSVMIIVTLTYVTLVMRADNHGEGGIMALITLLRRWHRRQGTAHRGGAGRGRDCSVRRCSSATA